jgi:eukaryotic-like serine/threonine-protein kinase
LPPEVEEKKLREPRSKLRTTLLRRLGTPNLAEPASHDYASRETTPGGERRPRDRSGLPGEGDIVDGHYRLVRMLGEGMFGQVFVAERTDVPEHRVAVKILDRAVYGGRNVERELVMLAAASHPHIVQLKDHGVTDRYVWLTMPLFEGETLDERVERGPLDLREAYEIFLPVARGLQALHARGLRHQDIKPENIFLATFVDGRVHPVLLDLGVAVECNSDFVAGTVLFAAPEQVAALGGTGSRAPLTEKIDTYCLASTLLRSLVGPDFFPGEAAQTPLDLAQALADREDEPIRAGALPELKGEPREQLAAAFGRWMTCDPVDRPGVAKMADELDVLLEKERAEKRAEDQKRARQKAALARFRVVLAMLVLAGIGGALYMFSKRETLRLAGELERARAEGAQSFDKLDTCIAANQVTQRENRTCKEGRDEDTKRHAAAVAALAAQGEGKEADLIQKLDQTQRELWTLQDELKEKQTTWTTEKTQLQATLTEKETAWNGERTEMQTRLEQLGSEKQQCETVATSAAQERDTCRAELSKCGEVYPDDGTPRRPPPTAPPKPSPGSGTGDAPDYTEDATPPPPPPPAPPQDPPGL